MTATAQRLVHEIRNLPLPDLLEVREQVNKLAGENPPPVIPAPLPISDEEFLFVKLLILHLDTVHRALKTRRLTTPVRRVPP